MSDQHATMWKVVDRPEEVLAAIESAPHWPADAIKFAAQA